MKRYIQSMFTFSAACLVGVAWAGEVTGKVVFEGDAPTMKVIDMSSDPNCAKLHGDKEVRREDLVLGDGQAMANVVVRVTKGLGDKKHPVPSEPIIVTQADCVYAPHVVVAQAGQTIKFLNPDKIMHNVNSSPDKNAPFNKAMPPVMEEMEVMFSTPEPDGFRIECNIHPWMRAYCVVLDHPYFSVTGTDGTFKIEGLEPGTYEITAWHERLPAMTAEVTVEEGKSAKTDFTFSR